MAINLGDKVKETITGFEGVVTARIEYLTGCIKFEVLSDKLKDGKPMDTVWFDAAQLIVVREGFKIRNLFKSVDVANGGSGNIPKICYPKR